MSFGDLNAAVSDFRDGLRAQIGRQAIGDLNIRPPAAERDEASFLRLTAWSYSLLFEVGRIVFPFLLDVKLPGINVAEVQKHKKARLVVQQLRTALSHNLGFDDHHDVGIRKAVSDWFVASCKAISPASENDWRVCFEKLCGDVHALTSHCSVVVSLIAAADEDKRLIIEALQSRLAREWEPHQFDQIIEDAASRLGERINARAIRDRRLGDWRKYMAALPDDADQKREIERVIDGEVADHFRAILPATTQELMDAVGLESGPRVKELVELARRMHSAGARDKADLLVKIQVEFDGAKKVAELE